VGPLDGVLGSFTEVRSSDCVQYSPPRARTRISEVEPPAPPGSVIVLMDPTTITRLRGTAVGNL
jgi:hypothetical protein